MVGQHYCAAPCRRVIVSLIGLAVVAFATRASAEILLIDDFDSGFDAAKWYVKPFNIDGSTYIDGTQLRVAPYTPPVHDGYLDLVFSTYNPTAITPGDSYFGSQIISQQEFLPTPGRPLRVASRARIIPPPGQEAAPGGIVTSMFLYKLIAPNSRDEVDVEILTKLQPEGPGYLTNSFVADPFSAAGDVEFVVRDPFDPTNFHDYEILWATDSIEWYLDGQLMRRETDSLPTQAMALHFNIWAPLFGGFTRALDPSLQPASTPAENVDIIWQLDSASVQSVPEPSSIVLAVLGSLGVGAFLLRRRCR